MLQERIQNVLSLKPHHAENKYRAVGILFVVCVCCVLPLFAVTCATKPYVAKAEEPLYGTWVNEEYAKMGNHHRDTKDVKYVIAPEGRFFLYNSTSDPEPIIEGRQSFEEKWTDGQGNVYYKAVYTSRWYPYDENPDFNPINKWYVLYRISAAGDVLESVWNQVEYAEEFSHYAGWYVVHYRQ